MSCDRFEPPSREPFDGKSMSDFWDAALERLGAYVEPEECAQPVFDPIQDSLLLSDRRNQSVNRDNK
jgi:hypothetical protein